MAIVTPSDDILVDGINIYSFEASGAISGAACVKVAGPMQVVKATESTDNAIGVASYETAKGDYVDVYGRGNIVRCCAASGIAMGADLFVANDGKVDDSLVYGGTSPCIGIALEAAVSGGALRVLLK